VTADAVSYASDALPSPDRPASSPAREATTASGSEAGVIHHGDCIEVMATFEAESIDAIVTDPPYGLEFMGKGWDKLGATTEVAAEGADISHPFRDGSRRVRYGESARSMQDWHEAWAREAFRVAKPGAHLLAFGGTRTYHRLAAAIEDAGWEIRDTLVWAYASGFPKSLDVSKAIDKAAGAERVASGAPSNLQCEFVRAGVPCEGHGGIERSQSGATIHALPTAPATDLAREWQGWGTALKPAWEPIVLARKPLRGTVAGNVTEWGTGALNIDGCRIDGSERSGGGPRPTRVATGGFNMSEAGDRPEGGRWPANVILTDPIFDGDTPGVVGGGIADGGISVRRNGVAGSPDSPVGNFGAVMAPGTPDAGYGDSGTYSRFFLIPKAARTDREPVLGGLPERAIKAPGMSGVTTVTNGTSDKQYEGNTKRANVHPTVKPTDLMRHLVRLVTPPGGVVLDPFLGSGTTAIAAELEGFEWVGIEREAEYCAIAEARLNGTQRGLGLAV
jgi:DNA modification methylase